MIIYFSGTGNSQFVAEAIADRLQDQVINSSKYIKKGIRGSFVSDTPWIFVYPIYVSTMAGPFRKFLEESAFFGCKEAYFIATCASDMGISVDIGREICRKKGLKFMGAEKVVMPQNYIALFKMTEPDEIRNRQANALKTADKIAQAVVDGKSLQLQGKSTTEKKLTFWTEKVYDRCFTGTKKFHVTDKCVSCSLCARLCPLNNIRLTEGKPVWGKTCVHCMSCINRCPKEAIEYGNRTAGKARYVCRKYGEHL